MFKIAHFSYICVMNRRTIAFALALLALGACQNNHPFPTAVPGSVVLSDRISNQKVNGFTEDQDGHIWIATTRGLNKFTDKDFYQYYCTDDTLGLPDNQINAVHAAQDGSLWAATVFGVAVRTPQDCFRRIPVPGENRNMGQILETRDGKLLFSNSATLFLYDAGQDALRPVIRDLGAFGTPPATLTADGRLWVISGGGFALNCYSTTDFSLLQSIALPYQTYHILDAGREEIWLSGMGRLSILDTRSLEWKELPKAIREEKRLMQGDIDILFAPDDNSVLLNVIGKGFFYYSRTRENISSEGDAAFPFDMPDTEVRSLFRDSRGNLWFGTTDQGVKVSYHDHGQFGSNKFLTQAMRGKNVTSVCADKQGGLWISTLRDGLYRYDLASKQLQSVETGHLIPDDNVGYIRTSKIYCGPSGDLWMVFSEKMRVIRCLWDGKRLVGKDLVYASNPMALAEDDRGCLWIGGFSGTLVRYDKKERSRQEVNVAPPGSWTFVSEMLLKEPGKILACRFGLPPVEVNTYSLEANDISLTEEERKNCIRRSIIVPNCLFKDSGGNIWMGTYANGLLVKEAADGKRHPVEGAPCMDITAIQEDRQGNIWVSTMAGLGKYDRTVGSFIHYFEADGIGGDQFNDRASCILPDGTLVFGGTHGITCFNPLDTPAKRTVPLVFENLTIHGQMVAPSPDGPIDRVLSEKPEVVLRASQNAFGVSFAALDYSEFEQIRYAYKLEELGSVVHPEHRLLCQCASRTL